MQLNHRFDGRLGSIQTLLGATFIDSAGLRVLIARLRQMIARQGEFRLCGLTPTVLALFELKRMNRVFAIHARLPDAMAALP